jgi:hypothetical protein
MRINTPIHKLTMDDSYKVVNAVVAWCKENLPIKVKRKRDLSVMVHKSKQEVYGQYCVKNHWLTVNLEAVENVEMLIRTTIHEFIHSGQNLKNYYKYNQKYGYFKNPLEKEANKYEEYYRVCWKQIKKLI